MRRAASTPNREEKDYRNSVMAWAQEGYRGENRSHIAEKFLGAFGKDELILDDVSFVTSLPPFPNVKKITIAGAHSLPALTVLPKTLIDLKITNCALKSLSNLPEGLMKLEISNSSFTSIPKLPDNINSLTLDNLGSLFSVENIPSNIEHLVINNCPRLIYLPPIPDSINFLDINDCPGGANIDLSNAAKQAQTRAREAAIDVAKAQVQAREAQAQARALAQAQAQENQARLQAQAQAQRNLHHAVQVPLTENNAYDRHRTAVIAQSSLNNITEYNSEGGLGEYFTSQRPNSNQITKINETLLQHIDALKSIDGLQLKGGESISLTFDGFDFIGADQFGEDKSIEWCLLRQGNNNYNLVTAASVTGMINAGGKHPTLGRKLLPDDIIRGEKFMQLL
jgi:hypothetical protein